MKVHIIDHNTVHRALLARLIAQKIPAVRHITFAKTHDSHDVYVENADLVIVSGGTWLVDKNPGTHRRLNDILFRSGKPVIGICLGAEALAQYLGVEVVRMEERVSGITSVSLSTDLQQYMGVPSLPVYEYHTYTIPRANEQMVVLAKSPTGIEAFKHTVAPVWGLQFHPEVQKEDNEGYKIFEFILAEIASGA